MSKENINTLKQKAVYLIQHQDHGNPRTPAIQTARKFSQAGTKFNTMAKTHEYLTGALFLLFVAGKSLDVSYIQGGLIAIGATLALFKIWKQ